METATAASPPAGDGVGEKGRKAVPPNRLPSIPRIYLSTGSGREKICLLPEDLCLTGAGSQSFSLPNLTLAPDMQGLSLPNSKNKHGSGVKTRVNRDSSCNGGTSGSGNGVKAERRRSGPGQLLTGTQLSVYCSPRVSRRGLDCWSPGREGCSPGEGDGEYSWRRSRRGSNSSAESDSSLRSASHVSTCATSDYTRFTSCDALSLANDISPATGAGPASFPLGRLRRIYSNPESPMLNAQNESQLRDSKSCSALEEGPAAMVNYLLLEQTLSKEGAHLLSPPTIIPASVLRRLAETQGQIMSYEQIYDEALKASIKDGTNEEDLSNKNSRIRQWLSNVTSQSACADSKAQPSES